MYGNCNKICPVWPQAITVANVFLAEGELMLQRTTRRHGTPVWHARVPGGVYWKCDRSKIPMTPHSELQPNRGPIGPQYGFWGPFWTYFRSRRALEFCKIAIGFIWAEFQAKWSIPGPVWTHCSFLFFLLTLCGSTWDQGIE